MRTPAGLLLLTMALVSHPRFIDAPAAQRPPNFIVIYADDLGYADIGPFSARGSAGTPGGTPVNPQQDTAWVKSWRPRTPNLDRMAEDGIRLTNFYVA